MIEPKIIIETLFGVKLSKTTNFIINFSLLIFIILGFWLIPKYAKKQGEKMHEEWNELRFSGIVDSLSIDYKNHAITTIYLKNGFKKGNLPQHYFYSIKKNDSINKLSKNDSIFIKRNNEVIIFK